MKFVLTMFLWLINSYAIDPSEAMDSGLLHYHDELKYCYETEYADWQEAETDEMTMYVSSSARVRDIPDASGNITERLSEGDKVTVIATVYDSVYGDDLFYRIKTESGMPAYVLAENLITRDPFDNSGDGEYTAVKVDDRHTVYYREETLESGETDVGIVGHRLDVDLIYQNPELPQGCEITALTMALNYIGVEVDKCDMADTYLPKSKTLDADPEEYYLRNPRTNGFYCFAPVLVKTIDRYNRANKTDIYVEDLTGSEVSVLYDKIAEGTPVVVWGTLLWGLPYKYSSGLYGNLHCMVLSGYTGTKVYITDSIYGATVIDRATFETVWKKMGSRALIVENTEE